MGYKLAGIEWNDDGTPVAKNEALEALRRVSANQCANFLRRNEDIIVIEKELKQKEKLERDYELLKKQYDELLFTANDLNNENIELLRHKKAIDFIKSRGGKVVRNALGYWFEGTFKIAEEEYDEFKEVLKDEN